MNLLVLILSLLTGSFAYAIPLKVDQGKTEFLAIGRPSALRIAGQGAGPKGDLSLNPMESEFALSGQVDMDLASFETGIGMRDRHMKEKYLEVEKFPKAVLILDSVRISKEILEKGGNLKFPGKLSLHGIEKPVDVEMSIAAIGPSLKTSSKFKLKLSEFGIEVPKFSGITVADEVEVTAETEIAKPEFGKST